MNPLHAYARELMLGTARRAPERPALDGDIGLLLQQVAALGGEDGLDCLRLAGVLAACDAAAASLPVLDAGQLAAQPAPVAPDEVPWPQDGHLLTVLNDVLLEGSFPLRREACELLQQAGLTLPPHVLPRILAMGGRNMALRAVLLPVLGARGAWLAHQQSAWSWAAGAQLSNDAELWAHGNLQQRRTYLSRVRERDAEAGRTLLAAELPGCDARERAALLDSLAVGLSPADEALLLGVLGDRSKEVRQIAAALLARLPEGAYRARMQTRVSACLRQERKLLRRHWVLDPPEQFAPEWKDDALEATRPKGESLGERGWWLYQLARMVPLPWWCEQLSQSPAELVQWAHGGDWYEVLVRAWRDALAREPDPAWAEALLAAPALKGYQFDSFALLALLPQSLREAHWAALFEEGTLASNKGELLTRFVEDYSTRPQGAMTPAFARRLLSTLRAYMSGPGHAHRSAYELVQALPVLMALLPAECLDEAGQDWPGGTPETRYFDKALAAMLAVIEQRKTLYRTLSLRKSS